MEKVEDIENENLCSICFELLNKPMKCNTCQKNVCKSHAVALVKCPMCRAEPFKTEFNEELENKIVGIRTAKREKQRDTIYFNCRAKNCKFNGDYKQMVLHHKNHHPYLPLDMILYGDYFEIEEKYPITDSTKPERTRAEYASENTRVTPAGQRKKTVNYEQALKMVRHCNICPSTDCLVLYSGPWGSFIGGSQGKTHFDLTECSKGKAMNIQAGWNYHDFRH